MILECAFVVLLNQYTGNALSYWKMTVETFEKQDPQKTRKMLTRYTTAALKGFCFPLFLGSCSAFRQSGLMNGQLVLPHVFDIGYGKSAPVLVKALKANAFMLAMIDNDLVLHCWKVGKLFV